MRILRGLSCEANILTAICNRWNVPIGSLQPRFGSLRVMAHVVLGATDEKRLLIPYHSRNSAFFGLPSLFRSA